MRNGGVRGFGGEKFGQFGALGFGAGAAGFEGEGLHLHLQRVTVFDFFGGQFGNEIGHGLVEGGGNGMRSQGQQRDG